MEMEFTDKQLNAFKAFLTFFDSCGFAPADSIAGWLNEFALVSGQKARKHNRSRQHMFHVFMHRGYVEFNHRCNRYELTQLGARVRHQLEK